MDPWKDTASWYWLATAKIDHREINLFVFLMIASLTQGLREQ